MSPLPEDGPLPIEVCPMCRGHATHIQWHMSPAPGSGVLDPRTGITAMTGQAICTMHPCGCTVDPERWEPHGEEAGGAWYREWRQRRGAPTA